MSQVRAHVSRNAVQGSLRDVPLERLLSVCRAQLLTGRIEIDCAAGSGSVVLRAGMVDDAEMAGHKGAFALSLLRALRDGTYEIAQRLPGPDGKLGDAAAFRGEVTDMSLVELMRHCEDNALTCTITVIHQFDRAELVYRAGELVDVTFNGVPDDDKIVDIIRFEDARFLVSAPPLDLSVDGWPVVRRAPTEPFHIGHLGDRPRARTATGEIDTGEVERVDAAEVRKEPTALVRVPRVQRRGSGRARFRKPRRRRGLRARAAELLRAASTWLERPRPIVAEVVSEPAPAEPERPRWRPPTAEPRTLLGRFRRWLRRR